MSLKTDERFALEFVGLDITLQEKMMSSDRIEVSPPMFRNGPFSFIGCMLLIPVFGIGLLLLLGWYLKCRSTKLVIDADDLLLETGIFSKSRSQLTTGSIRTIKVEQSFINRIFNVGTLQVFTAGDLPEVVLQGFSDPALIRQRLLGKVGE